MGVKALVSGGILALLATSTMAQSLDPVRVEMFRSILAGNECTLTEAAAANILPRFDFTRDETRGIVGALVAAGEVQLDGNTLMLVDGSCATADPVADLLGQRDVQQFISVMAEHGCAMTEDEGERIFTERGMDKAQVGAIVGPMIQAGMASFGSGILSVDSAYCMAPVAAPSGVNMEMVASLREIFLANSCYLTEAQMDELLPPAGFTRENAFPIFDYLDESGELNEVGDDLAFINDACTANVASPVDGLDRSGMFGMTRVRQLVDVMTVNGCTFNTVVADDYLADAGMEFSFASNIVSKMLDDGFATTVDGENVRLSAPYCIAAGGVEAPSDEITGVDMEMVASLRQIFLANNCRLDEYQMDDLLPPAGFTRDNIKPIFDFLEANGEMADEGDDLVLYDEACGAAPVIAAPMFENDGSPRARFMAAVIGNGCALEVSTAESYLADEAGLRMDQAFAIVDDLVLEGEATLMSGGTIVQLDLALCAEGGTALVVELVNPVQGSAYPASPEGVMLSMMRRNSCEMLMADARAQFPVAGVTIEQFHPLLDDYLSNGRMDLSADGQTISYIDPMCFPTPGSSEISDAFMDEAVAARNAANAELEARTAAIEGAMAAERGEAQLENDPRADLLAMLAANSCQVTQANAAELIAAAGLDFNTSMQMLTQMMGSGEATSPDGGQTLNVSAPLCVATAAEPMTPREAFINLIKQNNCSITAAEFSAQLPVDGLDANTAFGMIGELEAEGVISLPATRDVVTLSAEMCR